MDENEKGCCFFFLLCLAVACFFGYIVYQDIIVEAPKRAKEAAIAAEKAKQAAEMRAVPVENKTQVAEAGKRFVAEFHGKFSAVFRTTSGISSSFGTTRLATLTWPLPGAASQSLGKSNIP